MKDASITIMYVSMLLKMYKLKQSHFIQCLSAVTEDLPSRGPGPMRNRRQSVLSVASGAGGGNKWILDGETVNRCAARGFFWVF